MRKLLAVLGALALVWLLLVLGGECLGPGPDHRAAPPAREGADSPVAREPGRDSAAVVVPAVPVAGTESVRSRGSVSGTVVDRDGNPVAGATVRALRHRRRDLLLLETVEGPETASGPEGRFALDLHEGEVVDLRAEAGASGSGLVAAVSAGASAVRIVVGAGPRLVVTVRDPNDSPVTGARVLLLRAPARGHRPTLVGSVESDAVGRAVFEPVAAGPAGLIVSHPYLGSAPFARFQLPDRGEMEVPVVVGAGRDLGGRVLDDATGEPIAGARVGETPLFLRTERTGEDGIFVLRGVTNYSPEGPADRLFADADGYAIGGAPIPDEGPVVIRLRRGNRIAGRVTNGAGAAVPDALVEVLAFSRERREGYPRSTRSGGGGAFALHGVRCDLGPRSVRVSAPGYGDRTLEAAAGEEGGTVDLGAVVLPAAGRIGGIVREADGAARAGALVNLVRTGAGSPLPDFRDRMTDAEGRFLFPDLGPGHWRVEVADGGGEADVELPAGGAVLDLDLAPPAGGALRVRVVDDAGDPVAGARLQVVGEDDRSLAYEFVGPDGRRRFSGLPAGTAQVWAFPPLRNSGYLPSFAAAEAKGQEIVLVMKRVPVLAGTVTGPDGKPVAGRQVMILEAGGSAPLTGAITDGRGRFEAGIPAGTTVDVFVTGDRLDPREGQMTVTDTAFVRNVRVPSEPLVIRTEAPPADRELTVYLLDPDGRPVRDLAIVVIGADDRAGGSPFPDDTGRARLTGLAARPIRIAAPCRPGMLAPLPIDVVPGGQEIELRYRESAPLRGTLRDAAGSPVPDASVMALERGTLVSVAKTDSDGAFEVPVPPDAPVTIRAMMRDARVDRPDVRAAAGPIDLVLTSR